MALCPAHTRILQPALQPATTRRVSEPAIVSHTQQTQAPVNQIQVYSHVRSPRCSSFTLLKGVQSGPTVRQFASPPLNSHAPNRPVVSNPMIVAGPSQAYNYHRAQFPPPQQAPAQLMPPPAQQLQHALPQQQLPAIRPRPGIDHTNSDDERVPKRQRMASDPDVSTRHSAGPSNYPQHPAYAQVPFQASYQAPQQRNLQTRPQLAPMDHLQHLPMQANYQRRSAATPPDPYQRAPPPTSPSFGANSPPNAPAPSTSAPPIMDAYRVVASEQGATRTQGQLPDTSDQMQGIEQSQHVNTGPAHPTNVGSRIPSAADAGTNLATAASPAETPAERSTGAPLASTPVAPPPDSVPVSPEMVNGQAQGGGSSLPPLTGEQTKRMRSELADSMFTEPKDDDKTQARVCVFCE